MSMNLATLLAAASKDVNVVGVCFKDSAGNAQGKVYHYKTGDLTILAGDEVVVNSPYGGFVCAIVKSVQAACEALDASNGVKYTWIVQKVDAADYQARIERDKEDKELLVRAHRMIAHRKALKELKDALGADGVDCPELQALVARLSGAE